MLSLSSLQSSLFLRSVCVAERLHAVLCPPRLLLSASESGTRRKRPIIKNPSLHLCSVGINHFFAFLFSFFPLLWLSDIPRPFPPSPKPPLHPVTHAHAHMQAHSFASCQLFLNFASDSSQSLKIAIMLPGPSSAPYLIIFERKAGWGCLLIWVLLWWQLYPRANWKLMFFVFLCKLHCRHNKAHMAVKVINIERLFERLYKRAFKAT